MEINLELRSIILECSLNIEKEINNLLLMLLGIHSDNKETRLFGNKPKITFQNKIDLLFDLQILSKEENYSFEMMMNFRNKFLHDLDCNSFRKVFEQIDGIEKNYKKLLLEGENINAEKDCLSAFKRLFLSNLKVISEKIEDKQNLLQIKIEFLNISNDQLLYQIDIHFNLIKDIHKLIEKHNKENLNTIPLSIEISKLCEESVDRYSSDLKFLEIFGIRTELLKNPRLFKDFWNISKSEEIEKRIK